ncbi:MAG: 4Fe-4S binding protein [Dictyoglomus thermophilum]|uniref:NIL domain-containing protein n=1 Tax=Dictyoglomus thermophilum TaxID=14 RepID=UPI0011EAE06D|nr:NIL domain-containing protein [Dictyoglomus thermophilum]MCX7720307.1 4Fe-4S binding protein [Dictyoglomus thermophilum]TYT23234.1 4Fe-4S dicluster domain-containing protein [Dictyoglomus thermophilum]
MRTERIVLHFPKELADKPVIVNLVKKFNLDFNILKATITPDAEGVMVLEITGEDNNFLEGIEYLRELGVSIQPLSKDVIWLEDRCVHCGYCVSYCPTKALNRDEKTLTVGFDSQKCTACGICVEICPYSAMEMKIFV